MTRTTRHTIPVQSVFDEWHKDPGYVREFKALETEYKLADQLIKAGVAARPTRQRPADESGMAGMKVFISHSHRDDWALERLQTHLSALRGERLIHDWFDREIRAGDELPVGTGEQLSESDMFLFLASADFLASDYCRKQELAYALGRQYADETRLAIPIVVAPCDWVSSRLGRLEALPRGGIPITEWSDHDRAFLDIVTEIRRVAEENQARLSGAVTSIQGEPSDEPGCRQDRLSIHRIREDNAAMDIESTAAGRYFIRGNQRMQGGEYDGAIADYCEAIRLEPDFAAAWSNKGSARSEKGEIEKAIADFSRAIRLQPNCADARYNRGVCRYRKGEYYRAAADFHEALGLRPDKAGTS